MFERFTNSSRRAMALCQYEAGKLRHNVISPHHLALGLLRLEEERGDGPLTLAGVDLPSLRESIEAEAGPPMPTGVGSPPFTPETKRVMGDALKEALQLGDSWIGPGHQLLALIKSGTPAVLAEQIHIEQALQVVREYHRLEPERPSRSRTRPRLPGFMEVMKSAMSRSTPATPAGSQHILLTLVARQDTLAGRILAELGVTEEKVRQLIDTLGTEGTLDEPPEARVEVRLGDRAVMVRKGALNETVSILRKRDPQSASELAELLEDDDPMPDP